jgi:DNA-binding transcriptional MocR family regulator
VSEVRRGRRLPFVVLPHEILDDHLLAATDILVYATVARHADDYGQAFPSRQRIAKLARCSPSTVDRSVNLLKQRGYLEVIHREGTSNLYVVHEVREARRTVVTHDKGGSSPVTRGLVTDDEGGSSPMTTELELTNKNKELEAATSEWTLPPDDIREMLEARTKAKA